MIIDSHTHYGNGSGWGSFSAEELLEITTSVDYLICSNLDGIDCTEIKDERECNLDILEVSKRYQKIKPLAVCEPNISEDENIIRELLINNKEFVGLKIHPEYMKLPADSEKYDKYLNLAREFKKPCLYHSGHTKSRFSSPHLIYKKAQEFPDVPIILGHLSTGPKEAHEEAIQIILDSIENEKATLYVDTSWIDFAYERLNDTYEDTLMLIEALRNTKKRDYTHRILWGTDAFVGKFNHTKESYDKNLEVFKSRVMERFNDEELLENLLWRNAKNLYAL